MRGSRWRRWSSDGRDAHRWVAEGLFDRSRTGFLAHARSLANSTSPDAARLIFNDNLNAGLSIFFMLVVVVVILASAREWYLVAVGRKVPKLNETPYSETALAS